jgi:hypothetical protein
MPAQYAERLTQIDVADAPPPFVPPGRSEMKLTDQARAVAGALFGIMKPGGGSHLTFQMRESRPTKECQAALDELVAAGVISREPLNQYSNGVVYTPLVNCFDHYKWLMRNDKRPDLQIRIAEPIAGRSALQQREGE